jgi:hypothetical protein
VALSEAVALLERDHYPVDSDLGPMLPYCQFCAEEIQPDDEAVWPKGQVPGDPIGEPVHVRCPEEVRQMRDRPNATPGET